MDSVWRERTVKNIKKGKLNTQKGKTEKKKKTHEKQQ